MRNKIKINTFHALSTHCENQYLVESVVPYEHTCCVAVITHKEVLDGDDEKSLKKVIEVCGKKRDIFVILPNKADTKYYEQYGSLIKIKKIADNCLNSSKSYNKTLCTKEFYELFKNYDYALIYQTDCWIYEDKLDEFMKLGYDYYGAPWPHHNNTVGNGGFSLRKVNKMLEITTKYKYNENDSLLGNEDTWLCKTHGDELNTCDLETACNFSIEILTPLYLRLIRTHPMGLHGRDMKVFWDEDGEKFKENNLKQ